jgi:hypothetical protein
MSRDVDNTYDSPSVWQSNESVFAQHHENILFTRCDYLVFSLFPEAVWSLVDIMNLAHCGKLDAVAIFH